MRNIVAALLVFCAMPLFAQQELPLDAPIAKVGAQTITHSEFLSRYELTPGFQRQAAVKTDEKKAEMLFTLIAEKLLAQEAREQGLDRDTLLLKAVRGVERMFVRDELYRREVRAKVTITPDETEEAMRRATQDLKIYFLYARQQSTADSLYALIRSGRPLESFALGHSRPDCEGPDSAVARWGDADERMEEAVYKLKPNETAPPVKLDDGYYIPKLMGKTLNIIAGERERKSLKERVEQTLRKRKEQKRMFEFMASVLKGRKAEVKAQVTKAVVAELDEAYEAANPAGMDRPDTAKFVLTPQIVASVLRRHGADSLTPYVRFEHDVWTLAATLNKMRAAGLVVQPPTFVAIRRGYDERLRDLIDQEHLTQIGYERGLQHTAAVQNGLGPWRDWYLAQLYKDRMEDTISVSKKEFEDEKWRMMKDTLDRQDTSKAGESVAARKLQYFTNRRIASLADKYGVTLYEKNFSAVNVTRVPSMVYRYLGFGGRMFAVPLTEPNVRWVDFWDRKNLRLP